MMASRETTRILMLALCGLVAPALWTDDAPRYAVHTKGKIGFIDRAGKMVIKPQFDDAIHFQDGVASVKAGGKWRISIQPENGSSHLVSMKLGPFIKGWELSGWVPNGDT